MLALLLSAPAASFRADSGVPPTAAEVWFTVGLIVLASAALVFRRRRPLLVFAATLVPVLVLPPSMAPASHLLPALAIYAVAVYRSTRACWIALGVAAAAMTLVAGIAALSLPVDPWFLLTTLVSGAVALLIGALIGVNVGNRRRYLAAVIDRSRQLLVERDQQALLGAAAERTRIAREMHDIVSHNLTVVVALAEGATATTDPARARAATEQIAETARGALSEMRSMLGVLRGPDAVPGAPLSPLATTSPSDAVEAAQRAGFPVRLHTEGRYDVVPADVRSAVTRIVQESLTNAMRHAPAATLIDVRLVVDGDVHVEVVNDGVRARAGSASDSRGGYGLPGLRERAAHVGGELAAGPADGGRWIVRASLPVPAAAAAGAPSPSQECL